MCLWPGCAKPSIVIEDDSGREAPGCGREHLSDPSKKKSDEGPEEELKNDQWSVLLQTAEGQTGVPQNREQVDPRWYHSGLSASLLSPNSTWFHINIMWRSSFLWTYGRPLGHKRQRMRLACLQTHSVFRAWTFSITPLHFSCAFRGKNKKSHL